MSALMTSSHSPANHIRVDKNTSQSQANLVISCVNKTLPYYTQAVAASSLYAVMEPPKKTRRPRFTDAELHALVEEVEKRAAVILARRDYKTGVTDFEKQAAWVCVRDAVNAVSRVTRTVDELRRKFKDMRTHLKTKAAAEFRHMGGTGGGGPVEVKYSDIELKLLRLQSPTAYTGLPERESQGELLSLEEPLPSTSAAKDSNTAVLVVGEEVTIPIISCSGMSTSTQLPAAAANHPSPQASQVASAAPSQAQSVGLSLASSASSSQAPSATSSWSSSATSSREPSPPPQPPPHPTSRARKPTTPSTDLGDFHLVPNFLSAQQEIRDLLKELVEAQRSAAAAQRDTATAVTEAVAVLREGVTALQDVARAVVGLSTGVIRNGSNG